MPTLVGPERASNNQAKPDPFPFPLGHATLQKHHNKGAPQILLSVNPVSHLLFAVANENCHCFTLAARLVAPHQTVEIAQFLSLEITRPSPKLSLG